MSSNEGNKISDLPVLEGDVRIGDLLEVVSPVPAVDLRYGDFNTYASYSLATLATYDTLGVFRFATAAESAAYDLEDAAVTPFAIPIAIQDFLDNHLFPGLGVEKNYAGGVATFSLAGPEGTLYLMGANNTTGLEGIEGGNIPAAAPLFDYATDTVTHIYQRYRIIGPGETGEMSQFCMMAVDGEYAINLTLRLLEVDAARYAAITPYNVDSGLKRNPEWEEECTLYESVDVTLIDCTEDFEPLSVVRIRTGKFAIITRANDDLITVWKFPIVTYTSPTAVSVLMVEIDITEFDFYASGMAFTNGVIMRAALNWSTKEFAIALAFRKADLTYDSVLVNIDTNTGAILDYEQVDSAEVTPLRGLSSIVPQCLEVLNSSFYYKYWIGSFDRILTTANTNYGLTVSYKRYDSRELSGSGTNYIGLDPTPTLINAPTVVGAKLNALGYTLTDLPYLPAFGGASGFVI